MEGLIHAILLANNSQLCWMLHVASVCRRCCMLLRVVGSCCAKLETGQTSSYVQTDATLGSATLGSICCGFKLYRDGHGLEEHVENKGI